MDPTAINIKEGVDFYHWVVVQKTLRVDGIESFAIYDPAGPAYSQSVFDFTRFFTDWAVRAR